MEFDERDLQRIFQALCHEHRRLDALRPAWRDQSAVDHARMLRDRFGSLLNDRMSEADDFAKYEATHPTI